jgi:hypothetical protein
VSTKASYAVQKVIVRTIRAAKELGLDVGGVEVLPDGTVRVLTKDSVKTDAFAEWQKRRGAA